MKPCIYWRGGTYPWMPPQSASLSCLIILNNDLYGLQRGIEEILGHKSFNKLLGLAHAFRLAFESEVIN